MSTPKEGKFIQSVDMPPRLEQLRTPTEWIVITGAPSSGKTTIVERLQTRMPGFIVIPEITREIIMNDIAGGTPPNMTPAYNDGLNRRVAAKRRHIEDTLDPSAPTIMDRGTFDTRTYARYYGVEESYIDSDKQYKAVFIMDPLPFTDDNVRYENTEFVTDIDRLLDEVYSEQGFLPVRVAQFPYGEGVYETEPDETEASVEQRTRFILEHLGQMGSNKVTQPLY